MISFGISSGLRGWFAIVYDEAGPIQSGIGSYRDEGGAYDEAYDWALSEGRHSEARKILQEKALWEKRLEQASVRSELDF